jgi:hypothetical protein
VEFTSPRKLCARHWHEWWFAGYPDKERLVKRAIKTMRQRDRRKAIKENSNV